jgi:purine-nucleoside phosphorylase
LENGQIVTSFYCFQNEILTPFWRFGFYQISGLGIIWLLLYDLWRIIMQITLQTIDRVTDAIRAKIKSPPSIGLILGTGLGNLAEAVENPVIIPYTELPDWPASTVMGHAGRLVIGKLENQPVFVMQGRIHYYEGYTMQQVTLPVRVMQRLGIEILVVTNAAGAINPDYAPGDVMLITDNLNLAGMSGLNPLIGPNLEEFGPRFPDMSQAYDRQLCDLARRVARQAGLLLREGVYAGLSGPSFESPADLRFLKIAGADAVGMSTVSEVIVARHGGTRVLGFSGISNKANLDGDTITSHEEVLEAGRILVPKLEILIRGLLKSF